MPDAAPDAPPATKKRRTCSRIHRLVEVETDLICRRAQGQTIDGIAAQTGVPSSTVSRVCLQLRERVERMREQLRAQMAEKVLGEAGRWLPARMRNWANPDSRTAGSEMQAIFRALGMMDAQTVINTGDTFIGGVNVDVGAQHLHVDAAQLELLRGLHGLPARRGESVGESPA